MCVLRRKTKKDLLQIYSSTLIKTVSSEFINKYKGNSPPLWGGEYKFEIFITLCLLFKYFHNFYGNLSSFSAVVCNQHSVIQFLLMLSQIKMEILSM